LGFLVVKKYKYLGRVIDTKISVKSHVSEWRHYQPVYFKKNLMLHKKHVSLFSFIIIIEYFVKKDFLMDYAAFFDYRATIKLIDKTLWNHINSTFGLPKSASKQGSYWRIWYKNQTYIKINKKLE
jgi:hypothetical protein